MYVVLWDYQSRKFQPRSPFKDEVLDPDVQSVEEAIIEYKTKLNASLARHRIKVLKVLLNIDNVLNNMATAYGCLASLLVNALGPYSQNI